MSPKRPMEWPLPPPSEKRSFEELGTSVGRLVAEKNAAYGDGFARSGEIMAILYPDGIAREQLDDALGVVRVIDKLFRLANDKGYGGESPWQDIAGYGVLGMSRVESVPVVFRAGASMGKSTEDEIVYAKGCRL